MACAVALGSITEFKHWLSLFVRTLSARGHEPLLRMVVDTLMGDFFTTESEADTVESVSSSMPRFSAWWLSSAPCILSLDRKALIKSVVVPELCKNRNLQRLTNEISLQIDTS